MTSHRLRGPRSLSSRDSARGTMTVDGGREIGETELQSTWPVTRRSDLEQSVNPRTATFAHRFG